MTRGADSVGKCSRQLFAGPGLQQHAIQLMARFAQFKITLGLLLFLYKYVYIYFAEISITKYFQLPYLEMGSNTIEVHQSQNN